MLPSTIVRALTTPPFEASQFVATKWSSAEEKAKFANKLMKFIAAEFPRQGFTQDFYRRLSNTFGHIACYDIHGFYGVFFEDEAGRIDFLDQALTFPCYGDPACTFSDVERAVKARLRASNVIEIFRMRERDATRARELALLARLASKYGATREPPSPAQATEPDAEPAQPPDLFAA